ncbi:MAG: TerB family tellurite resistance protein [Gammaproteobacteria bacterium]|nr:TerB family tellurite resistance protein [Gammaproteobacteria bacterium]
MHIILAALGAVVTILVLINRLSETGIDFGWLNPFAWKRRRNWAKQYHANPVYSVRDPMEVTALLMVALAKSGGDMSSEQKRYIKQEFQNVFGLTEDEASSLIHSSVFLLKENFEQVKNLNKVLAPSVESFSSAQASSALELMTGVVNLDSQTNAFQANLLQEFNSIFLERFKTTWSSN